MLEIAATFVFTLLSGVILLKALIPIAKRLGLLDFPTSRKRHQEPVPPIGGIVILFTAIYGTLFAHIIGLDILSGFASPWVYLISVLGLLALGIMDDVRGLGARTKFGFQIVIVAFTVFADPQIREFCLAWEGTISYLIYPAVMVWILGLTNGINLIDGIDGLAGGAALLITGTLSIIGGHTGPAIFLSAILFPAILAFLRSNWRPAKVFLGDNGSLTIGYLLAVSSFYVLPAPESWYHIFPVLMAFSYPILDMGICTYRRLRFGYPIFKADRSHLHFRIQRLGLNAEQTVIFLLGISLFAQLVALLTDQLPPKTLILSSGVFVSGMLIVFYLAVSIEGAFLSKISEVLRKNIKKEEDDLGVGRQVRVRVSLRPLYEVGLLEAQDKVSDILNSLFFFLKTMTRKTDYVRLLKDEIQVLIPDKKEDPIDLQEVGKRFAGRIEHFRELFDKAYSLPSLPLLIERIDAKSPEEPVESKGVEIAPKTECIETWRSA